MEGIDYIKVIAEIIGYVAVFFAFVMFQQTHRKRLILCKLIIDLLWITHFVMLGGYTIVCTTSISVFRELVFINRDKRFFSSKFWLFAFILFYAASPIFTWEGIHSIFPALSSVAATISLWVRSVKRTKQISLAVSVSQLIYEAVVCSYAAMTGEIVTIVSIIIYFIRTRMKNGKSLL
ncbi:MAG: YgjV family protein [Clostridia bacterium]|nr:YgjV family protein [Clostridia bacterium]